jgi:hypothetical protein
MPRFCILVKKHTGRLGDYFRHGLYRGRSDARYAIALAALKTSPAISPTKTSKPQLRFSLPQVAWWRGESAPSITGTFITGTFITGTFITFNIGNPSLPTAFISGALYRPNSYITTCGSGCRGVWPPVASSVSASMLEGPCWGYSPADSLRRLPLRCCGQVSEQLGSCSLRRSMGRFRGCIGQQIASQAASGRFHWNLTAGQSKTNDRGPWLGPTGGR